MQALLLIFIFCGVAQASVLVTKQTVTAQLQDSPGVAVLRERLQSAERLKGTLVRSFLPKVNLTYGQEQFTTGPYHRLTQPYGGIEAEINLFNSGKDAIENEARVKEARLHQLDLEITQAKLLSEVKVALSQMAYLNEVEAILLEAVKLNAQNISGARKRIDAGLATRTDLIDFNHQKLSLNQELQAIKFEKGVITRLIAVLLGIDPKVPVRVEYSNLHPEHHHEEEGEIHVKGSKILKKANLYADIAKLQQAKAERWWGPRLELYTYALRFTQKEREYPEPGERNDVSFGFRFSLPLFDGGEGNRQGQSQAALARGAEQALRQRSLEVEKDTQNAIRKLELAHTLIHGAEESVKLMTDYRLAVINEYVRGIKNSPDVLQATSRWVEAKSKFAEVKKNYQIAKAEAEYLQSLVAKD